MICILAVPVAGIAIFIVGSARQFFLGNVELVRLAGLNDEFAPVTLPDTARNRAPEMTMPETVEDDLNDAVERLTELRSTGLPAV